MTMCCMTKCAKPDLGWRQLIETFRATVRTTAQTKYEELTAYIFTRKGRSMIVIYVKWRCCDLALDTFVSAPRISTA